MSKHAILIALVGLFTLCLGFFWYNRELNRLRSNAFDIVNSPQYTTIKNQDALFWYIKNNELYQYNLQTKQEIQITNLSFGSIENISFSKDGQKLYFTTSNPSAYYLGIYDLQTREVKTSQVPGPGAGVISISPNDQFLVYDVGCCPGNRGIEILSNLGEKINSLSGTKLAWSPNNKLALSQGTVTIDLPTGPAPQNESILILESPTDKPQVLLKATYQDSFRVEEWLDDMNVVYEHNRYTKPLNIPQPDDQSEEYYQPWSDIYNTPEKTYWKINIKSKQKEKIEYTKKQSDIYYTREEYEVDKSPSGEWIAVWNYDKNVLKVRNKASGEEIVIPGGYAEAKWRRE